MNHPPDGLLHPLPVPSHPWSHIALDFVSGFPPSKGNTVILTVVDHVFRLHGLPVCMVSDRGPQFASWFWKEFCIQSGASASLSSGFHPQTNGQCERANRDIERMLHCLTSNNPSSWCQQLSWIEYACNSLPVAASGMSPFECSVGYKPPLFPSQEPDAAVPSALAFSAAAAPGRESGGFWSEPQEEPRQQPIVAGPLLQPMCAVNGYGFLPRICLSGRLLVNWRPDSLGHTTSPRWLIQWRSGSSSLPLLVGFTLCFMSLGLSLCFLLPLTMPAIAPPP